MKSLKYVNEDVKNKKKGIIFINDDKLNFIPSFLRTFFIRTYSNQGFVYIDLNSDDDEPTYCSDTVKWLENLNIKTYSQKRADMLSWEYFHSKYPQYGKYIQLF